MLLVYINQIQINIIDGPRSLAASPHLAATAGLHSRPSPLVWPANVIYSEAHLAQTVNYGNRMDHKLAAVVVVVAAAAA